MPHLIDRNIFRDLKEKFKPQWEQTSSHKIRQSNDMQFVRIYLSILILFSIRYFIHNYVSHLRSMPSAVTMKYPVQAFSYFHFLINEKEKFDIHNIFGQYDTDGTGTWSDREIRTLLTRIYSLPLSLDNINSFEKNITDCERNLIEKGVELPIPEKISRVYERYYDSKLPLVTEFLVINCPTIVTFLQNSLGDSQRYKHKIMDDGEKYATFRRITSNVR